MARCEDCYNYDICEIMSSQYGICRIHPFQCAYYKQKSDVVQKSAVERLEVEIETLKDNNEHLAVMLEEAKVELDAMRGAANSYKMHYENLAREIFEEIESRAYGFGACFVEMTRTTFDELKKKYTGESHES